MNHKLNYQLNHRFIKVSHYWPISGDTDKQDFTHREHFNLCHKLTFREDAHVTLKPTFNWPSIHYGCVSFHHSYSALKVRLINLQWDTFTLLRKVLWQYSSWNTQELPRKFKCRERAWIGPACIIHVTMEDLQLQLVNTRLIYFRILTVYRHMALEPPKRDSKTFWLPLVVGCSIVYKLKVQNKLCLNVFGHNREFLACFLIC